MKTKEEINPTDAFNYMKHVLDVSYSIPAANMQALLRLCKLVIFRKKSIIFNQGEIANKIYFIHKGIVMAYYFKDEKMVIDRFVSEGDFIGGQVSYSTGIPNNFIFEAIEDSVMVEIDVKGFLQLCADDHEVQTMYAAHMTRHFKKYSDMIVAFRSLNAEDKYTTFLKMYGALINRISMKNIAVFLGMTHENLSRIRSRYMKLNAPEK